MKNTKHNTLGRIAAAMLALAIAFTGISLDGTITANAATTTVNERFTANGSVTMTSIGQTKSFEMIVTDNFGYEINMTHHYTWASSDESIVSAKMVQPERIMRQYDYILLTAHKNGTATITGTLKPESYNVAESAPKTATMTVTVNAPAPAASKAKKMTAKQRKCKHKYKISRKATCTRTGLKICTKCHWQVSLKKSAHLWSVETWYDTENTKEYYVEYCSGHDCELHGSTRNECMAKYGANVACPHACTWESGPCDTPDEALRKYNDHVIEMGRAMIASGTAKRYTTDGKYDETVDAYLNGAEYHGTHGDRWEYGDPQKVKITVKTCKKCGKETATRTPVE